MASHTKDTSTYYSGRQYRHQTQDGVYSAKSVSHKIMRTRTGSGVTNWKQKIANKQSATSALSAVRDSVETEGWIHDHVAYLWSPGVGFGGPQTQHEYVDGNVALYDIVPDTSSDTSLDSNVDGRASNKFLSAARELTTHMDGGTFLGELKQTLRMLRHPAEALSRSIEGYYKQLNKRKLDEVRRRRRKGLPQLPKDSKSWEWYKAIPDLWLEYSFGWGPLMMDIEDAFEALNSLSDREGVVHLSRAAQGLKLKSQSYSSGILYSDITAASKLRRDITNRIKLQTTVRYRGDVTAQAATTFADKAARWGFTASQFLPTAWELLPWSFLFDYFATIGDYLDASFTDTAALKWTCRTIRRVRTTEKLIMPSRTATLGSMPAKAMPVYSSNGHCLCTYKRVEVDRQPGVVPIPAVVFVDFQDQSSRHLANMSALFGSFCNGLHSQNPSPRNFRR